MSLSTPNSSKQHRFCSSSSAFRIYMPESPSSRLKVRTSSASRIELNAPFCGVYTCVCPVFEMNPNAAVVKSNQKSSLGFTGYRSFVESVQAILLRYQYSLLHYKCAQQRLPIPTETPGTVQWVSSPLHKPQASERLPMLSFSCGGVIPTTCRT